MANRVFVNQAEFTEVGMARVEVRMHATYVVHHLLFKF
jgi:hypothetical protein